MQTRASLVLPLVVGALAFAGPAAAAGDPRVAALQVALRARGFYAGPVDGVRGPATARAVRRLQRRAGLAADGVPGPVTLRALHVRELGARTLRVGLAGFDVAELQYALAWHGFPSGTVDGGFGLHTEAALRRFQRWSGLRSDGRGGPMTVAALRRAPARCPIPLLSPLRAAIGDLFGPRGSRFHAGIDLRAPSGTGIIAAGPGHVTWAGYLAGGWGLLVVIAHRDGVRTMYAHLSSIRVRVGERVQAGFEIGRVGATGDATGPHLHFEVRVRGAAVDPLPALRAGS